MKNIVIVTGGASGLGRALVKKLLANDYYVCNIDRDQKALELMAKEYSANYKSYCGDISEENFVIETINEINKLGTIVGLINNAGEPSFKYPKDYRKKDVDKCFKGLVGMILLTSQVLNVTNEQKLKIINIMSSAALRGNAQESVYCATKWGERGYTESLKAAYKGTNIKVIGVYPGGINTNFYQNSRDYVSEVKQNTFMNPIDVAEIIVSNAFNNINLTVSDLIIERNQ